MDVFTSSNGLTWTKQVTGYVVGGSGAAWDNIVVGNTAVYIDGANWYQLYEASNSAGLYYQLGLLTSSDGLSWAKYLGTGGPVISASPGSVSGPWLTKQNGKWYAWVHVATTGALPTDITTYSSVDLHTWTAVASSPIFPRISVDEGAWKAAGQIADPALAEANGQTYMWYSAYTDGTSVAGKVTIKLAIAPMLLADLANTKQLVARGDPYLSRGFIPITNSMEGLNGTTASFPGIKQVGTALSARLADDSDDTDWILRNIHYRSGPWLNGTAAGVIESFLSDFSAHALIKSQFQMVPTSVDLVCTASGDIGKQWLDNTTVVANHLKICAEVASIIGWQTIF
jgi:hypothetical protein